MKSVETKNKLEPNEPGSNRGFGCLILDKPPEPEINEEALENFREKVVILAREIVGEEKSIVFASGVLTGMALGNRKLENALDVVFPEGNDNSDIPGRGQQAHEKLERFIDDETVSSEESNRHNTAVSNLADVVSDWPTEKIESLCRLLTDERFVEKLHLVA